MKKDLKDCTFIIPLRIESDDRLRNIITVVCYILGNFETNIIVKEVDSNKIFENHALAQIKEFCENIDSLTYIFEHSEDPVFFREKILNDMLMMTETKVVVNYDCDVIFPIQSYVESYNKILSGESDVVYPYAEGSWQYRVSATDELVSKFLNEDFDLTLLKEESFIDNAGNGWVQFFNRQVYIEGGMENENFIGSAPDDFERYFRFCTLGYKVHRVDDFIYHLEHSRGMNSWPNSFYEHPFTRKNIELWEHLKNYTKEELIEYYSNQQYIKDRLR